MKTLKISVILLALLLAAMAMVPMMSAMEDKAANLQQKKVEIVQATIRIDPNTPSLNESEINSYVEQMNQKYGYENVKELNRMSSRTGGGAPDAYPGTSRVGVWTKPLDNSRATSDNALYLYKFNQRDAQGNDNYFYWHWSSAASKTGSTLMNFWSKNQLTNNNAVVYSYDPDSDITGNEVTVNVGLSYNGASISGPFTLHKDTVRPKIGECQVGSGGKYTVEWSGLYTGVQAIKGTELVVIPYGVFPTSDWTSYVAAM